MLQRKGVPQRKTRIPYGLIAYKIILLLFKILELLLAITFILKGLENICINKCRTTKLVILELLPPKPWLL